MNTYDASGDYVQSDVDGVNRTYPKKTFISQYPDEVISPYVAPVESKQSAKDRIDEAAGRARLRYVSKGAMVEQEYRFAMIEAESWDGVPPTPAMIQSWLEANPSLVDAAAAQTDIIAAGGMMKLVLQQVRDLRLKGKAAVDAGVEADAESIANTWIAQLDLI